MNAARLRSFCLFLSDVLCVAAVWTLVVNGYYASGRALYVVSDYVHAWPVLVAFALINCCVGLYHGRVFSPGMPLPEVEEFRRLVLSVFASHLLFMALLVLGHFDFQEYVSRFVVVVSALLGAALVQPCRYLTRHLLAKAGLGQIPAFLVGEGPVAKQVEATFASSSYYGFRIVRTFGREEFREIAAAGRALGVQHVFACYPDNRCFRAQFKELYDAFTFVEYLPTADAFPAGGAHVIQVGGLGGLEMANQRSLRVLLLEKSILDRTLAALIFLFALPFFVVMPVLIKLTSPGPVFYKAKRLGKKGRTIHVLKFRSMYADADARLKALLDSDPALAAEFAADFKLKRDPRVTPLGRFMRKTSIDELPQLLNVFTHDMALIGPRPIVEAEVERYGRFYEIFSSVKPGITGLWQASGRSNTDYAARVALDVHYVLNWSPWMDLWIVFKTALSVLTMRGSY